MTLTDRIESLTKLGIIINNYVNNTCTNSYLNNAIASAYNHNKWFTEDNLLFALKHWGSLLNEQNINNWISPYNINENNKKIKKVAIIMAGNIPLVGLHDFLSVFISGNKSIVKLSSKDNILFRALINIMFDINTNVKNYIEIHEGTVKDFDMVIATGSDNSSKYFDYYFGKYPHIIRKNRSSVAVLTGNETISDIKNLGEDLFRYFGLGCRNVSKIFVPNDYNFTFLFENLDEWSKIYNHNKWANNYDYHKSVFLMNRIIFKDNGFAILKEDFNISSPLSVFFYEHYSDICILAKNLEAMKNSIQCIVSNNENIENRIGFGYSQKPILNNYADNIDTLKFLLTN